MIMAGSQFPPNVVDREKHSNERFAALSYLEEAWEGALLDGLPTECVAQAALFRAFAELVESFGEEAVASFAEGLPDRLRRGEFTLAMATQ
jgi:hypothetical protein